MATTTIYLKSTGQSQAVDNSILSSYLSSGNWSQTPITTQSTPTTNTTTNTTNTTQTTPTTSGKTTIYLNSTGQAQEVDNSILNAYLDSGNWSTTPKSTTTPTTTSTTTPTTPSTTQTPTTQTSSQYQTITASQLGSAPIGTPFIYAGKTYIKDSSGKMSLYTAPTQTTTQTPTQTPTTPTPTTDNSGLPSTFTEQLALAQQAGIANYTGTAAQKAQIQQWQQSQTQNQQTVQQPTQVTPAYIGQTLQVGSTGADVSKVQTMLGGLTVDGQYGPLTKAKVMEFQAAHGLTADGIVGPKTWAALSGTTTNPLGSVGAGMTTPPPPDIPTFDENGGFTSGGVYYGPDSPEAINSKNVEGSVTPTYDVKTGNTDLDTKINDLLTQLKNSAPQTTWSQVLKQVYTDMGYSDKMTEHSTAVDDLTKLEDKKNDEAQDINNNPWYTEGERVRRLEQLDKKYEGKEIILQNKAKLLEMEIDNIRNDAQFITGQTMTQVNANAQLQQDVILKAIEIAEAQIAAESEVASNKDTQIVEVGGRKKLVDLQTGQVISDLGSSTTGTTSSGTVEAPTIKSINGTDMQWDTKTGKWVTPTGSSSGTVGTANTTQKAIDQLNFLRNTASQATALAGASGTSGIAKIVGDTLVGDTKYRQLEALTNTLKTNMLTLMTDPNIKKFFGPQMSNADVLLMTSAGTTINPASNSPTQMRSEIARLDELFNRMLTAVKNGSSGSNIITAPDGTQVIIVD